MVKKERPQIERVERQSAKLLAEQVAKLKEAFPETVTEGKVDSRSSAPRSAMKSTIARKDIRLTGWQTGCYPAASNAKPG